MIAYGCLKTGLLALGSTWNGSTYDVPELRKATVGCLWCFFCDTCLKCKNSLPNTGSRMSMKCRPQPMIRPAFPGIRHSPMKAPLNLRYFGSPSRAGSWMTCKIQDSLAKVPPEDLPHDAMRYSMIQYSMIL